MDILRFITAGNINDGKSTLIGRLLYESDNISKDILQSVLTTSEIEQKQELNLAFITDGLRSERQHGITIDVAYKYFTNTQRKFVVTDAPGHFQYTKNLLSGASEADAMIVLIDAENGITEQTKRHSFIAAWLNIPNVIVFINKMDKVGFDKTIFFEIQNQFLNLARDMKLNQVEFIPVSALRGDNVMTRSTHMPWYNGNTFMEQLNGISARKKKDGSTRVAIQYVINSGVTEGQVCYAGKILSGKLQEGDEINVFPGEQKARITKLTNIKETVSSGEAGDNICVYFDRKLKIKRGALLYNVLATEVPTILENFRVSLIWLDTEAPLTLESEYILRMNAFETECRIIKVLFKIDINTFESYEEGQMPTMNEFSEVEILCREPVFFDSFELLPETSRGIFIDPRTNITCAAFKTLTPNL